MKKKGLIISTIVMMLIVVVALSTATFAWFQVSADAKISTLTVQTASSDGLQIASIYDGIPGDDKEAYSGEMYLTPDNRYWVNQDALATEGGNGFGSELIFETALSSAYGVTGNGLQANMYTAASRTTTAYATVVVDATWFDAWVNSSGEPVDESDPDAIPYGVYFINGYNVFYSNSTGTTPAALGNLFEGGRYVGDVGEDGELARANLVTGGYTYYVRLKGYRTTQVTSENAGEFLAVPTTLYYQDITGLTLVEDVADTFENGAYIAETPDASDIIDLYVRKVSSVRIITDAEAATSAEVAGRVYYNDPLCTDMVDDLPGVFSSGEYVGEDAEDEAYLIDKYYLEQTLIDEIPTAWNYEANNSALTTGLLPRYMILARPNIEYFQLNFALRSQRGIPRDGDRLGIADIFIKRLAVTASGGMAASARIALFEYGNTNYNPAGGVALKQVFFPFSTSNYESSWEVTGALENTFRTAPTASQWYDGAGFAYNPTGASSFPADRIRQYQGSIYADSLWQTATFFDIDKNNVWADKALFNAAQANPTTELLSIGAFSSANATKYYQLVIWFEGEDAQCAGGYAGSGVTVDIAFDFYQRWAGEDMDYSGYPTGTSFVAD